MSHCWLWGWRKRPWTEESRQPLAVGKGKKTDLTSWHLDLMTFNVQNCSTKHLCWFKAQHLCGFKPGDQKVKAAHLGSLGQKMTGQRLCLILTPEPILRPTRISTAPLGLAVLRDCTALWGVLFYFTDPTGSPKRSALPCCPRNIGLKSVMKSGAFFFLNVLCH